MHRIIRTRPSKCDREDHKLQYNFKLISELMQLFVLNYLLCLFPNTVDIREIYGT